MALVMVASSVNTSTVVPGGLGSSRGSRGSGSTRAAASAGAAVSLGTKEPGLQAWASRGTRTPSSAGSGSAVGAAHKRHVG